MWNLSDIRLDVKAVLHWVIQFLENLEPQNILFYTNFCKIKLSFTNIYFSISAKFFSRKIFEFD